MTLSRLEFIHRIQDWYVSTFSLFSGFQAGPTFPTIPTFPYFIDLLLLFLKNALLSPLFHSKMSFTRKNPENFPHWFRLLGFDKLSNVFS